MVISGLYLRLGPMIFSTSNMALAEEEPVDSELVLAEKERAFRKKEQELKEREERVSKQEKDLAPLQKEIDAKLEELNTLQTRLTVFAKQLAEREKALNDAKMKHLVDLYSAMEPARAALIMQQLNMETVVRILANMKGKVAGKIVAMMEPGKGATISEKLSKMNWDSYRIVFKYERRTRQRRAIIYPPWADRTSNVQRRIKNEHPTSEVLQKVVTPVNPASVFRTRTRAYSHTQEIVSQ